MIKILHLVSDLSTNNGVMSVVMNYYRHINKKNVQFEFIYFDESENNSTYEAEIVQLGGKVHKISRPNLSKKFRNELNSFFSKNHNYTAIHIHVVFLVVTFGRIAKKYGIKNIISHSHNTKYSDFFIRSIRNRILCLGLKRQANYLYACSELAGDFLYGKSKFKEKDFMIINNAVDCEKMKFNKKTRMDMREKLNLGEEIVFGHVGRFVEQKNHSFLVDIFSEIVKIEKNAKMILVGDGPLETEIKNKVKALGLEDSVIFLGRRNDIDKLMQAFDVFVLPSLFEGLPVVGVEAQAAGLPIYMSSVITKEIGIANYNFINLKKSPSYWAKSILENTHFYDRNLAAQKMIINGFEIKNESFKLEELYKKM